MSRGSTENLVGELVRDLRAVRPIPRLRAALTGIALVFALALLADALLAGWRPRFGPGAYWGDPAFVIIFAGLAATAAAALVTALAGAVPGRNVLTRRSRHVALLGVAVVLVTGLVRLASAAAGGPGMPLAQHLSCAGHACALGLVPALFACGFLARASTRRPLVAAGVSALGAVSLGAVAIHAACGARGAPHWLLGHTLGPIALAAVLAIPLAALLRRHAQREA